MSDDSGKSGASLTQQQSQQDLLLEKIRTLLQDTDVDRWRKGGEPLRNDMRFEKPRQTWEIVYTLDIGSGVLVMRKSIPAKSEFQGRGFMLVPMANPNFTVEVRASGWHHTELTDPYKRSRISDRRCDILAEGTIAEELYAFVEDEYNSYHNAQQSDFDRVAFDFIAALPARLRDETVNRWDRVEDTPGEVHYLATIDGLRIDLCRTFEGERETTELSVSKNRVKSRITDRSLIKELLNSVEQVGTTSRLMTLTRALEAD